MPRRVVMVGSGYIAVEFAGIFAGARCRGGSGLSPAVAAARVRPGHARGDGRGAVRAGHHPASRLHAAMAGGGWRSRRILTLGNGTNARHRPGVLRHWAGAANVEGLGLEKTGVALNARRGHGRRAVCAPPAAHLRHRRRDRPGEPDAGRDRRGPRAGRLAVRQAPAVGLVAEHSVGGVHHAAARHGRLDGGAGCALHGPVDIYLTKFTPMRHTLSGPRPQER